MPDDGGKWNRDAIVTTTLVGQLRTLALGTVKTRVVQNQHIYTTWRISPSPQPTFARQYS